MTIKRLILLIAASLSTLAAPAGAAVVYDNLTGIDGATSGGTAHITSTGEGGPLGDSFSTGAAASTLADVKLALDAGNPAGGGSFAVNLFSNNASNNTPLTLLDTLGTISDSSLTTMLATVDVPATAAIDLTANTRYWIELASTSTSAEWSYTATNLGIGVANEYNFYAGSSSFNNSFTPYQMEVTTNSLAATPEPSAMALTAGALAGGWAFLRRRRAEAQ